MDTFIPLVPLGEDEDKSSPFINRLRKNYRHLRKWANRTKTNCFRLYDRDIKEYPLTIDYYDGRILVNYFAAAEDHFEPRVETVAEVQEAIDALFGVKDIYSRTRIKRQRVEQYEKFDEAEDFFVVYEQGVKFWVNLTDYLDTGLFLDHRETRQMVAKRASHKKLLNLFAYTGSFSVHAALQGAYTTTVDMSNTYLEWADNNFRLNQISPYEIIRADCLAFLEEAASQQKSYDVIVIDPPTLSRSKKMQGMFDIQKDYLFLLEHALKIMAPEGVIFFSTNARHFRFDEGAFPECLTKDISAKTIPLDFHNQKIHRCWTIERKSPKAYSAIPYKR